MTERVLQAHCYMNGCVVDGPNGIEYDCDPVGGVLVRSGMTLEQLKDELYNEFEIDRTQYMLNLVYRCPMILPSGIKYRRQHLNNDKQVRFMIDGSPTSGLELYLNLEVAHNVIGDNAQSIDLGVDMTTQTSIRCHSPPLTCQDAGNDIPIMESSQTHITPPLEFVQVPEHIVCDIRFDSMHVDIRRPTDEVGDDDSEDDYQDPFDDNLGDALTNPQLAPMVQLESEQRHIISENMANDSEPQRPQFIAPSPMFTQLDWNAIAEHVPVIGGRCTGSSPWNHTQELYVGLRFKDKSELKNAVKLYSIDRNLQYKVVESIKTYGL